MSGTFSQSITIPAGSLATNLTCWASVISSETGDFYQTLDTVDVEVVSSDGKTVLKKLTTLSPLHHGPLGGYRQFGGYDLSAYRGQTVVLRFRVTKDATEPTTFFVDDVSMQ